MIDDEGYTLTRVTEKFCQACEQTLPASAFYMLKNKKRMMAYLASRCRTCTRKSAKVWYDKNPDKVLAQTDRYRVRRQAERAADPEVVRLASRERNLLVKYKMTLAEFDARLAAQGGVCAMCGELPASQWHVDHDHGCCPKGGESCGKCVRGIVCARCNLAVGIYESHAILAAAYLERYAHEVIIVMDGDDPGKKAADHLHQAVRRGRIVTLPMGRDVNEMVQQSGPDAMRKLLGV